MLEIRLHGRGGQGAVTAAYLLAMAAFQEGYYAQAFPHFGVERRGAPVEAYVRLSDKPIRLREHVYHPEIIIVLDPSLLKAVNVLQGAHPDTLILIDSEKTIAALNLPKNYRILTLPATKLALETLGKPIINTVMLGAFSSISCLIRLNAIKQAIATGFPEDLVAKNSLAAETAFCYAQTGHRACKLNAETCNISSSDQKRLQKIIKT